MAIKTDWEKKATNMVKAELAKHGLNYDDLRIALEKMGIKKTTQNLNKTINLGKFSFTFFLQVMAAIEVKTIRLSEE